VNRVRRRLNLPYWSLSKHAKHKVKNAVEFISRFEETVAHEAQRLKVDGVVCGHIHTAEERRFGDVFYYNDGDWVEGCTALVEHFDGRMEILHWAEEVEARGALSPAAQAAPLLRAAA
jgi:UDP-2,3-diacylglucosamine pyrophosphatase LpxH